PAAVRFEIAVDPSMAGAVPLCTVQAGLLPDSYECDEIDLFGNATYYFRIRAANAAGTSTGNVRSFTTAPPEPPFVSTDTAVAISATSAELIGHAFPNGAPLTVWIDISTNSGMAGAGRVCQGNWDEPGGVLFSCTANGLQTNTAYYYRAAALNSAGTTLGEIRSFTLTGAAPPTGAEAAPASGTMR